MNVTTAPAMQFRAGRLRGEHRFFSGAALAMIGVIAFGFAPSFYLRGVISPRVPMEPLILRVLLHGILFSGFLLLFAIQVWLIAAGRTDVHRRLGRLAFVMVPLMVVVGIVTALGGVTRPLTAPPGLSPLSWLAVPLLDVPVFGTLLALGLTNRFRPTLHKRYMYVAMTDMMIPGFGRMSLPVPVHFYGLMSQIILPSLFLIALIAWDVRSMGRPQRVSLGAGAVVLAVAAAKPLIWSTPAWLHFAGWISAPFR